MYPFGDVVSVLTLSESNMNMNMNMCWYGVDGGGCGGCGWCVCPPVCLPWRTPTTFEPVESLWISLWKSLLEDTYLYTTSDGPAMCKIGYLEWVYHVKNKNTMGQRRGPKKRRRRHFVLSFSFVTCTRHDDIYMFILVIYLLLLAAFVAAASCLCRCF